MSSEKHFEAFMQRVLQRPIPNNPMSKVKTLAKELAEGATEGLWQPKISNYEFTEPRLEEQPFSEGQLIFSHSRTNVTNYVDQRWGFNDFPNLNLLAVNGYCERYQHQFASSYVHGIELTRLAFELLQENETSTIFISYKRSESSAFALLVNNHLKEHGISSYLDMAIPKGDDWEKRIKAEIGKHDYFILLLGQKTLASTVVLQELTWAMQFGKVIIPIWHNGYEYKSGEFPVLLEADEVLKKTNAIRVLEESALAYNNAIVELLNRFGITP